MSDRKSFQSPERLGKPLSMLCLFLAATAVSLSEPVSACAAAQKDGAKIYQASCAKCHGDQGQGTKKYARTLEGDLAVPELTDLIAKTMPEDSPGSLSREEAEAVARYIHDRFYSAVARERNRPARIELARLTVRQTRQVLADLVGTFRGTFKPPQERGLQAAYYSGRRMDRRALALERLDPQVDFDFGTAAPVAEKIEPHEFSIRWNGSVLATDTGEHEFVVRTEHACRLWVNDLKQPLIDAWVKSGNETEYRGSIYLLAGRCYPLRLEFSKSKQGVDDSQKQKEKPPSAPASIRLLWRKPGRVVEVIPQRHLVPAQGPEVFVCSTPFPPDDRSLGWERGTTVSKEWDDATTEAAIQTANYVADHLDELAGVRQVDRRPRPPSGDPAAISFDNKQPSAPNPERVQKLRDFARRFAERAFRRPLSSEWAALVDRQFEGEADPDLAVKRVVLLTLKSPRFWFREIGGENDGYDVAARLSFALWDSLPDAELLRAAGAGELHDPNHLRAQAERMIRDLRATAKLREFLLHWTRADHGLDVSKDPMRFPGFDAAVIADLRTSLELFLDDVLSSDKSDYRRFLLEERVWLNERLAKFYGLALPEGSSGFVPVPMDAEHRAGVLTHPYLMTSFAHAKESSPIHRGVFLARGILGVSLRPPAEAIAPLPADLHPTLTTRERVVLQTQPAQCMSCHGIINPLGFTLEHFDAVGRYRQEDNGKPVDASGSYRTRSGKLVEVRGARQLADFLVKSDEAHAAFIEQMFHHLIQQPVRAYGPETLAELQKSFAAGDFDIRRLAVEIAVRAAPRGHSELGKDKQGG
ncbi:MAG: DUF1592 domain-containing protein [Gemmatales bacterium]|nr:DUF1592 domain-containing protein [Gemmatales bacterium]MDW8385455.1 DUF1592 domain-containing protein [Gemmatales bacterium]